MVADISSLFSTEMGFNLSNIVDEIAQKGHTVPSQSSRLVV
jgi:hypothetical protein